MEVRSNIEKCGSAAAVTVVVAAAVAAAAAAASAATADSVTALTVNSTAGALASKSKTKIIANEATTTTIQSKITANESNSSSTTSKTESVMTSAMTKDERLVAELKSQIPVIDEHFQIHHRIGEGTFSTVFLTSLRRHEHVPPKQRRFFALKYLVPTSHPKRIAQELKCLQQIGGKDNVVGVNCCIRQNDAIAFVMPYIQHERFQDYFDKLNARDLQNYMRNLLIALKHVHGFNVIHRDVKPSNFLHDRRSQKYLLVDFGLAQSLDKESTKSLTSRSDNSNRSRQAMTTTTTPTTTTTTTAATISNVPCDNNASEQQQLQSIDGSKQQREFDDEQRVAADCATARRRVMDESATTAIDSIQLWNNANKAKRKASQLKAEEEMRIEGGGGKRDPDEKDGKDDQTDIKNASIAAVNAENPSKRARTLASNKSETIKSTTNAAAAAAATAEPLNVDVGNDNKESRAVDAGCVAQQEQVASAAPAAHDQYIPSPLKLPLKQHNEISTPKKSKIGVDFFNPSKSVFNPSKSSYNASNSSDGSVKCYCYGRPTVCNMCLVKREIHAPRAGTPGYRPAEVLLKYPDQTTAVDMWAAGVIFISILSGCYPFFKGTDDIMAIAEINTVFGDEVLKRTARALERNIITSRKKRPLHLRKLCIRLRNRNKWPNTPKPNTTTTTTTTTGTTDIDSTNKLDEICDNCEQIYRECLCEDTEYNSDFSGDIFPNEVYDLLAKLLTINPINRISAEDALKHPYFQLN